MDNIVRQRKLARAQITKQLLAAFLVALVACFWGLDYAIAGLSGGLLVVLGTIVLAARGLTRGSTGVVLFRMMMGIALRWLVILGGLLLVLVVWKWPPEPVIIGLAAALLVPVFNFGREP